MNVKSYLYQSPYPSSIQVGRPDPLAKKEESPNNQEAAQDFTQKKLLPAESNIKPTLEGGVSVNIAALEGKTESTVSSFKAISAVNQAQKAYSEN